MEDLREAFAASLRLDELDTALELVAAVREFAFRSVRYEILDWAHTVSVVPGAEERPLYPVVLGMIGYGRYVRGELTGAVDAARNAIAAAERLGTSTGALAERVLATPCSTAARPSTAGLDGPHGRGRPGLRGRQPARARLLHEIGGRDQRRRPRRGPATGRRGPPCRATMR